MCWLLSRKNLNVLLQNRISQLTFVEYSMNSLWVCLTRNQLCETGFQDLFFFFSSPVVLVPVAPSNLCINAAHTHTHTHKRTVETNLSLCFSFYFLPTVFWFTSIALIYLFLLPVSSPVTFSNCTPFWSYCTCVSEVTLGSSSPYVPYGKKTLTHSFPCSFLVLSRASFPPKGTVRVSLDVGGVSIAAWT